MTHCNIIQYDMMTGLILGLRPANERRRYFVTTSLIGWVQALNQPSNMFSRLRESTKLWSGLLTEDTL